MMHENFKFQVMAAVDQVKRPFSVSDIVHHIDPNEENVRKGRPDNILAKMKCLCKVQIHRPDRPTLWEIKSEPGEICEGCPFFKIVPKSETLACGRIEKEFTFDQELLSQAI